MLELVPFLNFNHLLYVQEEEIQEIVDSYENVVGYVKTSSIRQEGLKDGFDFCVKTALKEIDKNETTKENCGCCIIH